MNIFQVILALASLVVVGQTAPIGDRQDCLGQVEVKFGQISPPERLSELVEAIRVLNPQADQTSLMGLLNDKRADLRLHATGIVGDDVDEARLVEFCANLIKNMQAVVLDGQCQLDTFSADGPNHKALMEGAASHPNADKLFGTMEACLKI